MSIADYVRQIVDDVTDRETDEEEPNINVLGILALQPVYVVDRYIEQQRPFTLAKDPANLPQVGTILYNCIEALRIASILLWPFIPDACETFWKRIGCGHYAEALANNGRGQLDQWTAWGRLQPGTPIEKGDALFPRHQTP